MKLLKTGLALGLVAGLAGCADVTQGSLQETATRSAAAGQSVPAEESVPLSFSVRNVIVDVPKSLEVSEKNSYYPGGDIVWREDPLGDRHAQVKTIVETALRKGVAPLNGAVRVDLRVQVTKFHALTQKARYTTGGVHAIQFYVELIDVNTGTPLGEPHFVNADFDALGGDEALQAEAQGITQKVRITEHLAQVIQVELTDPAGYKSNANGLIAALNQL